MMTFFQGKNHLIYLIIIFSFFVLIGCTAAPTGGNTVVPASQPMQVQETLPVPPTPLPGCPYAVVQTGNRVIIQSWDAISVASRESRLVYTEVSHNDNCYKGFVAIPAGEGVMEFSVITAGETRTVMAMRYPVE